MHLKLTDEMTATVNVETYPSGIWYIDAQIGTKDDDDAYRYASRFIGYECVPGAIYAAISRALPNDIEIDYLWDIILDSPEFDGNCGCNDEEEIEH